MIIAKTSKLLNTYVETMRYGHKSIGFVPTMGAIHQGHLSLIQAAKTKCDCVVASIFVNPTQFNDPSDFEKYPITTENDILLLTRAGCDMLFLPLTSEMYPHGTEDLQKYELGMLENVFEGKFRPGHFQGVCQIVDRLLESVKPTMLFLGQKDYQQCMVINKLIEITQKNIQLYIEPTNRAANGLALSSRNVRLSEKGLQNATAIIKALRYIAENIQALTFDELLENASRQLLLNGFEKIDYISICNAKTLSPLTQYHPNTKTVVLIAAYLEGVRLIDNLVI